MVDGGGYWRDMCVSAKKEKEKRQRRVLKGKKAMQNLTKVHYILNGLEYIPMRIFVVVSACHGQ